MEDKKLISKLLEVMIMQRKCFKNLEKLLIKILEDKNLIIKGELKNQIEEFKKEK